MGRIGYFYGVACALRKEACGGGATTGKPLPSVLSSRLMPIGRSRRVILTSLWLLTAAAPAPSQAMPRDEKTGLARALFDHAETLYTLERWAEALDGYERAYEIKPLAGLLFNIAQCHRQLGHFERAAHFYHSYLERAPHAPNREVARALRGKMEALARNASSVAELTPPTLEVSPALPSTAASTVMAAPPTSAAGPGSTASSASIPPVLPSPAPAVATSGAATASPTPPSRPTATPPLVPAQASPHRESGAATNRTPAPPEPQALAAPARRPTPAPDALVAPPPSDAAAVDTPVYRRWWLWTLVGGAIVAGGGVAVGIAISQPQVATPVGTLSTVDVR